MCLTEEVYHLLKQKKKMKQKLFYIKMKIFKREHYS